ncbi:MAG: ATP-binding cassette domain-containing protein [Firmicutes bacterium]|nr:ATP-binding cassette domain-containing protein [Bacillota bacterium]
MQKTVQSAMQTGDTTVRLNRVSKEFVQWQRSGKATEILKNLFHPQQRVISALKNLSLEIKKGEFVAYAGANGAGKSTTIKILSGIMQPTRGQVSVLGLRPERDRVRLMRRVGIVFGQRTELWWDHPVAASFEWKKNVWDIPEQKYRANLALVTELLGLGDLLNTFARELSLGQRMRADLALMLLHEPELIFLDEPTLGLDVLAKRQMIDFLKRINQERQTTIVVTSHDMDDLEEMAQRIVLLSKGELAFDGSFEELRAIAGNICRIRLTRSHNGVLKFNGGQLITQQNNIYEYEFDTSQTPMQTIFTQISALSGIMDIEIRKAPIEQIVAGLYNQWRVSAK